MEKITMPISVATEVLHDLLDTHVLQRVDTRTKGWPLMDNPMYIIGVCLTYVYFVKVLGPKLMANRKAFDLRGLIFLYDFAMVLLSAGFFVYGGSLTYFKDYSFICQPVDYRNTERNQMILNLCWWYLMLKLFEFSDTIFFVLRKKFSHISTLHVTHHTIVAWGVWMGLKFGAGGSNAFFPFINCFVHTIMYTYYCIAALGNKRWLWWKKYLTLLQMGQFVIAFIHAGIPLVYDCGFNPGFAMAVMSHAVLFFVMFWHFYRDAYSKQERRGTLRKSVAIQSTDDNLNELKAANHRQSNGVGMGNKHGQNNNGITTTSTSTEDGSPPQHKYLYSYIKRNNQQQNGQTKNGSAKKGKKRR